MGHPYIYNYQVVVMNEFGRKRTEYQHLMKRYQIPSTPIVEALFSQTSTQNSTPHPKPVVSSQGSSQGSSQRSSQVDVASLPRGAFFLGTDGKQVKPGSFTMQARPTPTPAYMEQPLFPKGFFAGQAQFKKPLADKKVCFQIKI